MGTAIENFARLVKPVSIQTACCSSVAAKTSPTLSPSGVSTMGQSNGSGRYAADHDQAVTISAVGYMVHQAWQLSMSWLKQHRCNRSAKQHTEPSRHRRARCCWRTGGRLITVEDHQKKGGAGAIAVAQLPAGHVPAGVKILGVDEDFGQSAYTAGELYANTAWIQLPLLLLAKRSLAGKTFPTRKTGNPQAGLLGIFL